MAAVLPVLLAALPVLFGEQVPPPVNPTVLTLNTDYTLHWGWDGMDRQTATFTVQYIGQFRLKNPKGHWRMACEETSNMSCDLKPLNLHYLAIYRLRVRANVNGNYSEWVSMDFAPAKDAAVGPPSRVVVSSVGGGLEVSISEPQTSDNTSMKEKIPSLYYRFMYWERHTDTQRLQAHHIDSDNTIVALEDLKSWTWYCVSVQSRSDEPNPKNSTFTDPVCICTPGGFSSWQIILIFLASLTLGFLLVLGILLGCFHCCKVFQNSFNPKVPRPAFLDQYLHISPLRLSPDWQSELQCDLLTVIPEPGLLQIHMLSSSQQHVDSSARHSWESSSGSQDSGVYSTKSNSGNQTTSGQSSAASSGLSSGPEVALDQLSLQDICLASKNLSLQDICLASKNLSLQDICLASKNVQLIPDEGFGDITM